ncbi:ATP-binding protein, partial [Polaribacter sp.]|nr:ATP-binding protein [Polaribacter sp.]
YIQDSVYDKAKDNLLQSIEIHKNLDNKINQASALGNLSSIYLLENDYEKAKKIYFEAIELIENINTDEALRVKEDLYFNLAFNLYNLKDYKAYEYQELSYLIKDSIRDKQVRAIVAEINEKYNFDNKKNLLIQEQENKRLKHQRAFLLVGILGVLIILSLLYWVNFYKLKQKNLGLKLSQTQLLQNQKLEKLKSDAQTRILNATLDGKETERKQIAETLHDSVSALLSSANLHLQATKTAFNGNTPVEVDKTREIISEASKTIRDLSHSLVSSVLLKFGLKFAVKDMASKFANSQLNIITDIQDVGRYEQNYEIKVHNIIQEFINNILKHSGATEASIDLKEQNEKLYLQVKDNGVGFQKEKIANKDGLGINQIEARIHMMKGEIFIDSQLGKGTSIFVEIPIKRKEVIHHA